MKKVLNKRNLRILGVILLLVLLAVVGAFAWVVGHPAYPTARAEVALRGDALVKITTTDAIEFMPTAKEPTVGIIFYPGGLVEPGAYSQIAHTLAGKGYLVVIPRVLFNLAIFSPNAADAVIAKYPQVTKWVVAGHSLGGTMAARYAYGHDNIKGLILLASYPEAGVDFSAKTLPVISIYGSEDKLAGPKVPDSVSALPKDAQIVKLDGANHAGFADYGKQNGDGEATISAEEQQLKTMSLILDFLENIK